jgi:class 3 adenylate cyclase
VMALWGVPEQGKMDSLAAVQAAMDIRLGMAKLNRIRGADGQFTLNVGIGIHSGSAIFGAIGNGARVDHTVIGPTINIASRLQGLTRTHQIDIILSYELYQDVKDHILIEDLGMAEIRGMVRQVGHVKLIGLQMSNGQFVIGSKILEAAIKVREPGMVQNTPPNVMPVEYSDEYSSRIEDHITAA